MTSIAFLCDRAGPALVLVGLVLFGLSVWAAVRWLGFDPDRNNLIGSNAPYYKRYMEFKQEFPLEDDIVVVIQGSRPTVNRQVVDRIGGLLRADPAHFTDVEDKIDLSFVRRRLLLYMSVSDLRDLQRRLKDVRPFLERMLSDPGLVPLFVSINDEIQSYIQREINKAMSGQTVTAASEQQNAPDIAGSLPILSTILNNMASNVAGKYAYHSPWAQMFAASRGNSQMQEIPKAIYLEFQDGRTYLVLVKASEKGNPPPDVPVVLDALQRILVQARGEFPGVQMGLTGEPVLETDEMQSSQSDSIKASIISLVGVVILFVVAFGSLSRPFLATVSLVLAMGWTIGFATIVIGHLNILTITCMPMLIGLGIDFGIQVISRYEEERLRGFDPAPAMANMMAGTGASIVMAGVTTATSFVAARFTGFKGVGELGTMAGAGIALSVLSMLVILPSLLLMAERRRKSVVRPSPLARMARVEAGLLAHPWGVLFVGLIFTWICVARTYDFHAHVMRVRFDSNLIKLQSLGTPSVEWEQRLLESGGRSVLYAAVVAESLEQARVMEKNLSRLPDVASVESAVPLFPQDQADKLKIIPGIRRELASLPKLKEPLPPIDLPRLRNAIEDLRSIFFLVYPEARKAGQLQISDAIRGFVAGADQLLDQTEPTMASTASDRLFHYQSDFFHDLADKLDAVRGPGPVRRMTVDALPPLLRKEMIGRSGKLLLRVFPKEDIWDGPARARFLDEIRTIAPDVTGSPVMMQESTLALRRAYELAGIYAFCVIVVFVFLHFRSLRATLLALTPLLLGLCWMVGIMGIYGIAFNPANYLVLPLILGIGVANGIYIVRRYQEEHSPAIFSVSTGRAIMLSNLTAMIGFASLMIARYQGILSLGMVMTLGVGTCMVASLVMLPALLQILSHYRVRI